MKRKLGKERKVKDLKKKRKKIMPKWQLLSRVSAKSDNEMVNFYQIFSLGFGSVHFFFLLFRKYFLSLTLPEIKDHVEGRK